MKAWIIFWFGVGLVLGALTLAAELAAEGLGRLSVHIHRKTKGN